jgi:hypothetical protein
VSRAAGWLYYSHRRIPVAGEVFDEQIVIRKHVSLSKLRDSNAGEHLADGREVKFGINDAVTIVGDGGLAVVAPWKMTLLAVARTTAPENLLWSARLSM